MCAGSPCPVSPYIPSSHRVSSSVTVVSCWVRKFDGLVPYSPCFGNQSDAQSSGSFDPEWASLYKGEEMIKSEVGKFFFSKTTVGNTKSKEVEL